MQTLENLIIKYINYNYKFGKIRINKKFKRVILTSNKFYLIDDSQRIRTIDSIVNNIFKVIPVDKELIKDYVIKVLRI